MAEETNGGVTQDRINRAAWEACDTFRGVVDPSEYKNYILVTLFLKYISDVHKDKVDELRKKYPKDEERVERMLRYEPIQIKEESTFDYLYENRNADDIGQKINVAIASLEDSNRGKLDGVFKEIDFNSTRNLGVPKERNKRLKHLLEDFAKPDLDLRPSHVGSMDIIGNTYEYLISRFASDSGKKGGEFYTPGEVSELMARLISPKEGDKIYDPTCGSGSLLVKAGKQVGSDDFSLYGQESNGNTYALCKMNMFLHGINSAFIEWGDTIRNPRHREGDRLMKFDIVVANPPFSLDKWGADEAEHDPYNRFWRGTPPKTKGDYAFITHMIESLNEHGRMVVVVPHGCLFRGSSEGKIREQLIKENLLDAVIGLPSNLFFGTGIPAALLIFRKNRRKTDVLFIDGSNDFLEGSNQNVLEEEDIVKIVKAYKGYKTIDKYSYVATIEEIEENDFNLNIPRYVDTFEEEEIVDIPSVQKEIRTLESELDGLREKMDQYLKELGLS
ncbi:MAG: type I restriction-modification system subunit M [Lewinellaceae bacterium]|nr:type I restriction-modification system subunit M [Lewinellaceae bacterium]